MILKRNISTFAAVLALMAFMLLSASPAKAFKTTNPDMTIAYDECLTNKYQGKAKDVKKCFEDFRTTYADTCLAENRKGINQVGKDDSFRYIDNVIGELRLHILQFSNLDLSHDVATQGRGRRDKMMQLIGVLEDSNSADAAFANRCEWDIEKVRSKGLLN